MNSANTQREKRQNAAKAHYALRELNIPVEQVVDTLRMRTTDWNKLKEEVQQKAKRICKEHKLFISFTI